MPFQRIHKAVFVHVNDTADPGYGIDLGDEVDNSLPTPPPPGNSTLPVLPGIWPPPNTPNLPVHIGAHPENPIVIPSDPAKPWPMPPGIYPPLPPTSTGKYAVLIYVFGVGHRWVVVDTSISAGNPLPPTPTPKG